MTKLDLSALKKQKINLPTSELLQSGSGTSTVATTLPSPIPTPGLKTSGSGDTPSHAPLVSKPKLSLSSFKKGGEFELVSTSPVQEVVQVVQPEVTPALQELTILATEEEKQPEIVTTVDVISQNTEAVEVAVVETPVVQTIPESKHEKLSVANLLQRDKEEVKEREEERKKSEPIDQKKEEKKAEFFPNLSLENNDLFGDIVGMGDISPKEEEPEPLLETVPETSVIEMREMVEEASHKAPVTTLAEDASEVTNSIDLKTEIKSQTVEMTETEAAPQAVLLDISEVSENQTSANIDGATPSEAQQADYAQTVAKDLSEKRKGGLSVLFNKNKKVLFGIAGTAVVSIGIIGSLFGLGIFDSSKASVSDVPTTTRSVKTEPANIPSGPKVNEVVKEKDTNTQPSAILAESTKEVPKSLTGEGVKQPPKYPAVPNKPKAEPAVVELNTSSGATSSGVLLPVSIRTPNIRKNE